MTLICTPEFPGSGSSRSASGTADAGGTENPGESPVMSPAAIARSASITQDGGSSGSRASNVTASAPSSMLSVPALRLASGFPKSCPTSTSIWRESSSIA